MFIFMVSEMCVPFFLLWFEKVTRNVFQLYISNFLILKYFKFDPIRILK